MTADDRDRELSHLFEAERLADESSAPSLDALLARRPRRRSPAGAALARIALATSVAAVAAAAALVLRSGAGRSGAPAEESVQLAEWRSPTAFLLDTPGSELLTEVPTLSTRPIASAESGGVAAPQPTKGVAQ